MLKKILLEIAMAAVFSQLLWLTACGRGPKHARIFVSQQLQSSRALFCSYTRASVLDRHGTDEEPYRASGQTMFDRSDRVAVSGIVGRYSAART